MAKQKANMMSQESFELECDRLSQVVDDVLFEHLRWARTEGPMLARLVALAHSSLESRSEFELTEEGATNDIKRFILKVHGNRVMAFIIRLDGPRAHLSIEAIERSKFQVQPGDPITIDFELADERWMLAAMQELFGRIQA